MSHHSLKKHYFKTLSNFLIITGIVIIALSLGPVAASEGWYILKELKNQTFSLAGQAGDEALNDSVFARLVSTRPISIEPVNKDFSLVIEKIGVNAPVVKDVSVTNSDEYLSSLKDGIAHASVSPYPGEGPGNVYLFAHASVNFWQLGKYSGVFNLLRKLDVGDRIHLFYDDKTYVYETVNKEVHEGWNTYPITRPTIEPTLTLQTCDPPGTTLNRLVVTANLVEVQE